MIFARPINTKGKDPIVSTTYLGKDHPGIDYAYPDGEPIYASADGKVVIAKDSETRKWIANPPSDPFPPPRGLRTEDYGNLTRIDHAEGYATLYAHQLFNSLVVKLGDTVKKGQLIGKVGSTGNSTGNHLHWEVRKNNVAVDPRQIMDMGFSNYGTSVTSSGTTPTPSNIETKKSVQVDKIASWLKDEGYATDAGTEQYFNNPADPDKFFNKVKAVIAQVKVQVDTQIVKEEGRLQGRKEIKDAVAKL